MSKGQLQRVVSHYRQQLHAHETAASAALNHAYANTLATIQPQLDKLYREIAARQATGEKIPASWLYDQHRLTNLKQHITQQVDQFGTVAHMTTQQVQHNGVALGIQSAQAQLQATVPKGVSWTFGMPSSDAIASMVGSTQAGSPLASLFAGFGAEAAQNVSNALVTGLAMGNNPRMVARSVQQALGVSRNRALVISRQTMIDAYRSSNLANYQANSDVCRGWLWIDAPGACAACSFMGGSEHTLDEEMESHICCRCTMAPLTYGWSDILSPLGIDTSGLDESDNSIDVPGGEDWFAQQDDATQLKILGSTARYEAYKGGVSLGDMVGHKYDPQWGGSIYVKPLKELVKS